MICELHNNFWVLLHKMFYNKSHYERDYHINLWTVFVDLFLICGFPIVVIICIFYRSINMIGDVELQCTQR